MNRRELFKRLAVAGLVAGVATLPEPVKRYWALDQTQIPGRKFPISVHITRPAEEIDWHLPFINIASLEQPEPATMRATFIPLNLWYLEEEGHDPSWNPTPRLILPGDPNWNHAAYEEARHNLTSL